MPRGKIAMIVDRGFGFITAKRDEVFFDSAAVEGGEFEGLRQGLEVQYELADQPDPRRQMPQAHSVRVIGVRALGSSPTNLDIEMA